MFPFPVFVPRPGPTLDYRTFLSDVTDLTTYTFTSVDLGLPNASRVVGVVIGGASNGQSVSSVTIGGVSAAQQVAQIDSANTTAAIWTASVPSGATGNIVVAWTGGQTRCTIGVWAIYNLASATKTASAASTAKPSSLNLNVSLGDVVILGGVCGAAGSCAPTGYTERYDTSDAEGEGYSGGDYTATLAETPRTITMTWTTGSTSMPAVAAAFR